MENDLLAITSAQIMELNQNLGHIKNISSLTSLTFQSIDIRAIYMRKNKTRLT